MKIGSTALAKVMIGSTALQKVLLGTTLIWQNWIYKNIQTLLGDTGLSGGYPSTVYFDWGSPSNNRIVRLRCEAYVYQHTGDNTEYATVTGIIQGWNGGAWVTLASGGEEGTFKQGATVYSSCEYAFNPYNTAYTSFRFISQGNGFRRGVAGYKKEWYEQG